MIEPFKIANIKAANLLYAGHYMVLQNFKLYFHMGSPEL